jgi:1,4-alpha-glucan branching enzyme
MKPFEVTGLPPDELNSFLSGTHSDPFRILGPHRLENDLVIRVFRPDAKKIDILLDRQGDRQVGAEKIHRDGFFCATVPGGTRELDYRIRVTGWDGLPAIRINTAQLWAK